MSTPADDERKASALMAAWQRKIQVANQHNLLHHCQHCQYEWVTSTPVQHCAQCGQGPLERIACWQFPDG